MNTNTKQYDGMIFDDLISRAQQGDKEAVAHILYKAKYREYTFYYHMRIIASKHFKYSTDELFDGLVNDIYVNLTKNDFHALKEFKGGERNSGDDLKNVFYAWLMKIASNHFNAERVKIERRRKYQTDIDHCVVAVQAEEYTGEKEDHTKLREAIAMLKKDEQRIVLEQSLEPGEARRSVNIAKVLTEWRQQKGNSNVATEADVNCIKSRAYIALRPMLLNMGLERTMRKKVVIKTKNRK